MTCNHLSLQHHFAQLSELSILQILLIILYIFFLFFGNAAYSDPSAKLLHYEGLRLIHSYINIGLSFLKKYLKSMIFVICEMYTTVSIHIWYFQIQIFVV